MTKDALLSLFSTLAKVVQFFVEDTDFNIKSLSSIPDWLAQVSQLHQQSILEINYIFCSDNYLLKINQEYLSHDYYTDIITFDHRDEISQPIESDVFISVDRVADNADDLNIPFFNELLRVIVHGLLHLLGFPDSSDQEKETIRSKEDEHLTLYFKQFHQL
ncbi:MAG: rRNA maturation RNase YbeY [Bacteroidota bacterium]